MKIKLTENIGISGKSRSAGEVLTVGKDVSAEDAKYIKSIGRAVAVSDNISDLKEPAKSSEAKISDKELIARAEELGIRNPGKKSREELERLIAEAEKLEPIGSDITDPDDEGASLESLDEQELIVLAKELGFEDAEAMDKVELIDAIIKATAEGA